MALCAHHDPVEALGLGPGRDGFGRVTRCVHEPDLPALLLAETSNRPKHVLGFFNAVAVERLALETWGRADEDRRDTVTPVYSCPGPSSSCCAAMTLGMHVAT